MIVADGSFLERRGLLVVALGYLGVMAASLLVFRHPPTDDDICHHMMAADAWHEWRLFLHIWGRPGFTLIHAGPALLGFLGTRIFSILLTLGAGLMVARVLKPHGAAAVVCGFGFTVFQTALLEVTDGGLTETVYAFALALGLLLHHRGRPELAALAWSYTAICRLEGAGMLPLFALLFLREEFAEGGGRSILRLARRVFLLGALPLLWNLICVVDTGFTRLLPLVTENEFLAETAHYGTGPWYDYLLRSYQIHTPVIALLLVPGVWWAYKSKRWLAPSYLLIFYFMQSLLWATGWGRTAGYNRFFASAAPVAAIVATHGWLWLHARPWARRADGARRWFATPLLAVALAGVLATTWVFSMRAGREASYQQVYLAVQDIKARGDVSTERRILTSGEYPELLLNLSAHRRCDIQLTYDRETLATAPKGTLVLFTAHKPMPWDGLAPFDLYAESERERLSERIADGRNYVHLLKETKPRFRELADFSLPAFSWYPYPLNDPDHNPWPTYVKLFEIVEDPDPAALEAKRRREAAQTHRQTWVWGR